MDIKKQLRALEWVYSLAKGSEAGIYIPQKPRLEPVDTEGSFEELLPEQVGVDSEALLKMFAEISTEKGICPHLMAVLRNGKLIAKAEWTPFEINRPHVSHSMSKSVVSMAVGIALEEGLLSLDEKLADIFSDKMPENPHKHMNEVTIEHLLTMSSGASFNEARALMANDWVKDFLSSEITFEPGKKFHYNSLNTYMLSAILCKRTGISLTKYLEKRLFSPMKISGYYWEKCPLGIEKGGWGLYMGIMDYAKLGQLYLNGGIWNGKRLVSAEWIAESTSKKIAKPGDVSRDGYGYQIWILKNGLGFLFSGMFGQNVFVFPKRDMVIAVTSGSSGIFPQGRLLDIVTEFAADGRNFSSAPIRNFRYADAAKLRNALAGARFGEPLSEGIKPSLAERIRRSIFSIGKEKSDSVREEIPPAAAILAGNEIVFDPNRSGLLPVLIQVMNGNFEQGIDSAAFTVRNGILTMRIASGEDKWEVPLSFSEVPAYFDLEVRGDVFHVGTFAAVTLDEDEIPVLRVTMCFTETSCTKIFKFIFGHEGVILKVRESPELYSAIEDAEEMLIMPSLGDTLRKTLEAVLETDVAGYKIKSFLEPNVRGEVRSLYGGK